jgi:hypothetical protein
MLTYAAVCCRVLPYAGVLPYAVGRPTDGLDTSACVRAAVCRRMLPYAAIRQHASPASGLQVLCSIRQHTSAYVSICVRAAGALHAELLVYEAVSH